VEVRKDTSPTDRTTPAEEEPAPSVPRRTVADLERAEAQALERRRAGRSGAQAFAGEPTAPAREPRRDKRLADLGRSDGGTGAAEETKEQASSEAGRVEERPDQDLPTHRRDPQDGVFHRAAQNARKLRQLFGHPVPGEEPEPPAREGRPDLGLDHGTGEHERLGDTPHGVPAQHSRSS